MSATKEQTGSMNVFGEAKRVGVDLAKKFLFQVELEFPEKETSAFFEETLKREDFVFRAKTATIPAKEFTDMTTEYMGLKLNYPGKVNTAGEMTITFDEFQDGWVSKAFHTWQQLIVNTGFQDDEIWKQSIAPLTGGAYTNNIQLLCANIKITMYTSNLKDSLPVVWRLYRCWPKNLASVDLGQEDDGKVQRSVTFSYSNWELIDAEDLK